MGFACRGITHCFECGTVLGHGENGYCKECEEKRNKEEQKEEIKNLIKEVLKEERNKEKDNNKKEYEIKRIDRLSLGYKTFFNREAFDDEIEICMWDEGFSHRWTIASFNYNETENTYDLLGNEYLLDVKDWKAFGELVKEGYDILKNFKIIY